MILKALDLIESFMKNLINKESFKEGVLYKLETIKVNIDSEVIFSEDHLKRYFLKRCWDQSKPVATALMLNPSRADHIISDQTVDFLIKSFDYWGYGSLQVVNLLPTVKGNWRYLNNSEITSDPENNSMINQVLENSDLILLAWGAEPFKKNNLLYKKEKTILNSEIYNSIRNNIEKCTSLGKVGKHPKHPRYDSINTKVEDLTLKEFNIAMLKKAVV